MRFLLIAFLIPWSLYAGTIIDQSNCKAGSGGHTLRVAPSGAKFAKISEALAVAKPGDTVLVAAGKYKGNIKIAKSGKQGACINLKGEKGAEINGGNFGFSIEDKEYISIEGFNIKNISGGSTPTGIRVEGSSHHIDVKNNKIEDVKSSANAHAISFYGRDQKTMNSLWVEGNEIRNCKLGRSEALVFNGNVENFSVNNNKIRNVNNVGIDFIGFEKVLPSGGKKDRARHGVCKGNILENIHSDTEADSDAIYVDGAEDITISDNQISNADIGIGLGSERAGQDSVGVKVLANKVTGSKFANIVIGGETLKLSGGASNITIDGNSLSGSGHAEIVVQNNARGVSITNNNLTTRKGRFAIVSEGYGNVGFRFLNNQSNSGINKFSPMTNDQKNEVFRQIFNKK